MVADAQLRPLFNWDDLTEVREDYYPLQLANLYLIQPQGGGLVIYDQHAVAERVLLEQLLQRWQEGEKGKSQELLWPLELELNEMEKERWEKEASFLRRLGFRGQIEGGKLILDAVPLPFAPLPAPDWQAVLREFLRREEEKKEKTAGEKPRFIDHWSYRALVFLACRSAVKKGDPLSLAQRRQLLAELEKLGPQGLTCPHGRPTAIKISGEELEKRFKRR